MLINNKAIIINDTIESKGVCTVSITSRDIPDIKSVTGTKQEIRIIGDLRIPIYINIIDKIETNRFMLTGVNVSVERIHSDINEIQYVLTAKNISFKQSIKIYEQ